MHFRCEVQFDYGLRQLRNRPLKERPQSFITSAGKEIQVKTNIAEKNAHVMDKGKVRILFPYCVRRLFHSPFRVFTRSLKERYMGKKYLSRSQLRRKPGL